MANINNYYKYSILMSYMYNNKLINFDASTIQSCVIDFDYVKKNMPIIIISVEIDRNVLDDMITHQKDKTVILTISKIEKDSNLELEQKYIEDEFIYFLSENKNYNKELDYEVSNLNQNYPINRMKVVTIGLMKKSLIDNNKILINGVYENVRPLDVIYNNLKHMNLLIEPLYNNEIMKHLIIPPLDTVTNFINYMNRCVGLYDNLEYNLFYDFDKTYLLSNNGIMIPSKNELLSSVIFYIHKTIDNDSKIRGITIDRDNKAYLVDVDANDSNIIESKAESTSYSDVSIINNQGQGLESNKHIKIIRNQNQAYSTKKTSLETVVNIVKTELDTSVFTINKEYYIRNYNKIDGLTAKFRLIAKKEVYSKEGKEFNLANVLSFKKI